MKKLLIATTALVLTATMASAFSFPAHEPDGWRDTGCDEAKNVYIKNAAGKTLYLNNPTCPDLGGSGVDEVSGEAPGDGPGDGDTGGEGPGDGDTGGGDEGPGAGDNGGPKNPGHGGPKGPKGPKGPRGHGHGKA